MVSLIDMQLKKSVFLLHIWVRISMERFVFLGGARLFSKSCRIRVVCSLGGGAAVGDGRGGWMCIIMEFSNRSQSRSSMDSNLKCWGTFYVWGDVTRLGEFSNVLLTPKWPRNFSLAGHKQQHFQRKKWRNTLYTRIDEDTHITHVSMKTHTLHTYRWRHTLYMHRWRRTLYRRIDEDTQFTCIEEDT